MNKIEPKEVQNSLLAMLKQFHSVCIENDLRYYMIGGTALGARRHTGFIPWDDDVDIGMPRNDYEKFCSLSAKKLPADLELRFYKNTEKSPFCFVKLVNNQTTLIEQAYKDYVEGLYIDIFPFDGIKDFPLSLTEKLRLETIWFKKVMVLYNTTTLNRSGIMKKVLMYIAKHKNLYSMQQRLDQLMQKYKFENSAFVINYLGAYKYREILRKEYLGTPKLYKFEDTELYGPEKIDEFLTAIYGNYMELPPENARVFKHDYFYLDLKTPFREYEAMKK